ncbi:hypothetical protein V7L80_004028 [Vibrio harveyi]
MQIIFYILGLIYIMYISIESFGLLARYSGYYTKKFSVGLSIQNQVYSLNRLLGFLIAPLTGFASDLGADSKQLFILGLLGTFVGGFGLIVVYNNWHIISGIFVRTIKITAEQGYSLKTLVSLKRDELKKDKVSNIKYNYLFAQILTTGMAMPSVFILNILALRHPEFKSTLLQMATLISGLGNLILNFYTMPLLAVSEVRDDSSTRDIYRSIFWGKIIGMIFLSPILISVAYYV